MLISYERRFLFIHVPKTGGTSMRAVLQKYAHQPEERAPNRLLSSFGISVNHLFGHYTDYRFRTHEQAHIVARRLPNDVFERLFKFGFVRDPWDLLPSLYRFIRGNHRHKRHAKVLRMHFSEFVEFAAAKNIANQKKLISDRNGNILLDFVGRFERLNNDCEIIAKKVGLDMKLPHLNRTSPDRAFDEYYDAATIRRVQESYRDDIEAFGYPDRPIPTVDSSEAA